MKIAHLSSAKSWRGGEQQCLYLAQGLAERGIEQLILAPPAAPLHEKAKRLGIRTLAFVSRHELDLPAFWRLRGILLREEVTLVHAHDAHGVTPAWIAGWLSKRTRRLCTRRVDFPLRGKLKYRRGMERVIAISEAVRQVCLKGGVPEGKLRVVYSGVDPDRLRGEYSLKGLRGELGIDRRADVLLNVAALTDHKDQSCLLEAMLHVVRDAPRTHLLIAGTGELEDALRAQARELALAEHVHFLGYCNNVGALLQLCDIFVMSSHLEGLCTAVLDAMAMARACVVTAAGGLPEAVVDGETGRVVRPRDPEALAEAIVELLGNKKQCQRMGRRGRARVLTEFTIAQMVEKTLAVYQELSQP